MGHQRNTHAETPLPSAGLTASRRNSSPYLALLSSSNTSCLEIKSKLWTCSLNRGKFKMPGMEMPPVMKN